jgi:cell division transport system permease protein
MTDFIASLTPFLHRLRRKFAESFGFGDKDAPASIVPEGNLAGNALMFVIAIMTFLASLTVGAVSIVRDTASTWQSQISREATIQIKPAPDFDMDGALSQARQIAIEFAGVRDARIVGIEDTKSLLEPWLGTGFDMESLPVPRLVIVTIDPSAPPDFAAMRTLVSDAIPNASVDDHRNWVDRLVKMASTMVLLGIGVLGLVLAATALAVVFATRGAMSGNGHIIEVLHFVGAETAFIARQFRNRFLLNGIKGALAGGVAAIIVFFAVGIWSSYNLATPEGNQTNALFGTFSIGGDGYLGVLGIIALVAVLTAETTRLTVIGYLHRMSDNSGMHA